MSNIPKLGMAVIGSFNEEVKPIGWLFDGKGHPNSVGYYNDIERGIELYGGYTIAELKDILALKEQGE